MRDPRPGADLRKLRHPHRRSRPRKGRHLLLLRALRRGGRGHRIARPHRRGSLTATYARNLYHSRQVHESGRSIAPTTLLILISFSGREQMLKTVSLVAAVAATLLMLAPADAQRGGGPPAGGGGGG